MRFLTVTFWILIVLIGVSFTALNSHPVNIDYYFGASHLDLPVLLFIVLILGVLLGVLVMLPALLRAKYHARQAKRHAKNTEQEVDNLRRIPIQEAH